jgi:L-gulono-1,4-lactone dehydrogenase
MAHFRNWAGTASCTPASIRTVSSEEQLVASVREASAAGLRVKVAGSGHSFPDIACTDGVMLRMDGYDAVLAVDKEARTITVQAGITIAALAERLAEHGLAMSSLGDIGYQTIAGAISTATHGTGARYGNISSQVAAVRMVAGTGEPIDCSSERDPQVFRAAQAGLGALGAISSVTIRCEDAFTLHSVEEPMRLEAVLSSMQQMADANEHFEFFWFPHTDRCQVKRHNRVEGPPEPKGRVKGWVDDVLMANTVYGLVCRMGRARESWIPPLARLVGAALSRAEYSDRSDRVFTNPRLVRFAEMEYAIPREAARDAVEGVRRIIDEHGHTVSFPVEVRFVAADDIFLSPSHERATCYVAVHMFRGMPYEPFFRDVEALMGAFEGRPHWGKMHFQTAEVLRGRYPRFDEFALARKVCDPAGTFRNPYTDRVLGTP